MSAVILITLREGSREERYYKHYAQDKEQDREH